MTKILVKCESTGSLNNGTWINLHCEWTIVMTIPENCAIVCLNAHHSTHSFTMRTKSPFMELITYRCNLGEKLDFKFPQQQMKTLYCFRSESQALQLPWQLAKFSVTCSVSISAINNESVEDYTNRTKPNPGRKPKA